MLRRENLENLERDALAPYASLSAESRGREYPVQADQLRTDFQRDRDRIIHCAAFRKLEYKTQVYVIHEGDYYRTRLTHTMEVAQIARALARSLALNADLTEAVALAHDLGHTPFGHSGEVALRRILKDEGGFEHNQQGLRVVERLEERYFDFPGLNLTWEVREGIAKHATSYDAPNINRFDPQSAPSLEGQLVDAADEIAYNHHDLDDALKMGIMAWGDLEELPWVNEILQELDPQVRAREKAAGKPAEDLNEGISGALPDLGNELPPTMDAPRHSAIKWYDGIARYPEFETLLRCRLIGHLIDDAVHDVLRQTERNIHEAGVKSAQDVRALGRRLVSFSPEMLERNRALRAFLLDRVYQHPHVVRMATKAEHFLEQLFNLFLTTPRQLPVKYQKRIATEGLKVVITDYISGMTDRYCLEEYKRAFLPQVMV